MAAITAALVKDLRVKTGAGMMDCKKALSETDGDLEAAVDWLRTKGLAAAAKKSGRTAAEGLVGVVTNGTKGAVAEVNAETDFVARNDRFQDFVRTVAGLSQDVADIEALKSVAYPGGARNVEEELTNMIATIGENMNLRRLKALEVSNGVVSGYVHSQVGPGLGKIGVLVALESEGDPEKLAELGKLISMHVAAANPQALAREEVDSAEIDRERDVLSEQARESGKPEEIIAKMVEGRLRKYYEEVCLIEQVYVIDGERKVQQVVADFAKDIGSPIKLTGFVRYQLGEGIDKEESDFAAEVAATVGG
jgi:elongation factor Ts|tara:strand:- start:2839 stop:3762 length:924 start_codon:yes stop_codon:yes gene_type:complete